MGCHRLQGFPMLIPMRLPMMSEMNFGQLLKQLSLTERVHLVSGSHWSTTRKYPTEVSICRVEHVKSLDTDSPAERAGLKFGDRIIGVNGENTLKSSHQLLLGSFVPRNQKLYALLFNQYGH